MSDEAAHGVGDAITQFVHLSLLDLAGTGTAVTQREALRERIKQHVGEHIGDAALSVDGIAQALNCSRRHLYNAFADEPDGVAGYILHRRLEACRRSFDDRRNDHRPAPPRHDNDRRDYDRHDRDHRNDRPNYDRRYGNDRHDNRPNQGGWDRHRSDWNRHPNYWDNRRHDRRDYARYRYNYGSYHAPRGYYHRAWHRGDRLPSAWYGRQYVVYDWRPYRLYSPPYGYHWVRVGNDVVLTALATGIVLDVLYDIWY
jgi:Ni/Co efflux regulator RcnB